MPIPPGPPGPPHPNQCTNCNGLGEVPNPNFPRKSNNPTITCPSCGGTGMA